LVPQNAPRILAAADILGSPAQLAAIVAGYARGAAWGVNALFELVRGASTLRLFSDPLGGAAPRTLAAMRAVVLSGSLVEGGVRTARSTVHGVARAADNIAASLYGCELLAPLILDSIEGATALKRTPPCCGLPVFDVILTRMTLTQWNTHSMLWLLVIDSV
jgi:hypothetical protein